MDPEIVLQQTLYQLLVESPLIIVEVVAIIIAIVRLNRHPQVSWCVIAAMGILLLLHPLRPIIFTALFPVIGEWASERFVDGFQVANRIISFGFYLVESGIWVLVLTAVFGWRRAASGDTMVHGTSAAGRPAAPGEYEGHRPKPISKGLFLSAIIAPGAFAMISVTGGLLLLNLGRRDQQTMAAVLLVLALPALLIEIAAMIVLIVRMWGAIRGEHARTTPGLAIGLAFVPFFNLYWGFQVYWGWTVDYNNHVAAHGLDAPRMPQGLAMTLCILMLFSIIPFVGIVAGLVNMVLLIVFVSCVCDGINALANPVMKPNAAPA